MKNKVKVALHFECLRLIVTPTNAATVGERRDPSNEAARRLSWRGAIRNSVQHNHDMAPSIMSWRSWTWTAAGNLADAMAVWAPFAVGVIYMWWTWRTLVQNPQINVYRNFSSPNPTFSFSSLSLYLPSHPTPQNISQIFCLSLLSSSPSPCEGPLVGVSLVVCVGKRTVWLDVLLKTVMWGSRRLVSSCRESLTRRSWTN